MSQLQVAHSGLWLATQDGEAIQSQQGRQWMFLDGATDQPIVFTAHYYLRIVPTDTPQDCLQPASGTSLTDGDLIVLRPIKPRSDCQLWQFVAVPDLYAQRGDPVPPGTGAGWYFIINKLPRMRGALQDMCMDVNNRARRTSVPIVAFRVKQAGVDDPKNQWWQPC
jgi:hypothetical protein